MRRHWFLFAYLALLIASHVVQALRPSHAAGRHGGPSVCLPTLTKDGTPERMAYLEWPARQRPGMAGKPPVILIHGAPGSGSDFTILGPLLADAGYRVIAVDLPGFGESSHDIADYSILAHAHRVLSMMDIVGIDRAHVLGWSNGGGVALHMADLAPDRIASLTMLASIGDQAKEGSGSYNLEHVKYALGFVVIGGVPTLIPHFGLLGAFSERTDFLRNFWDTDQRPLKGIMEGLSVPTLIIHGREDVLIRADAAEEHHQLIKTSSLIILRANHFLPFMQAHETATCLIPFLARHDTPGVEPLTTTEDLSQVPRHKGLTGVVDHGRAFVRSMPWWTQASALAKVVMVAPTVGIVACAMLVSTQDVDFMVAIVGIAIGLVYQTGLLLILGAILGKRLYKIPLVGRKLAAVSTIDWSRRMKRSPATEGWVLMFIARSRIPSLLGAVLCRPGFVPVAKFVLARLPAIIVWAVVSFFVAVAGMSALRAAWPHVGPVRLALALVLLALIVRAAPKLLVKRGRYVVAAWWARAVQYEYWPMWLFYLPLVPYLAWLAIKHRGITVLTCCNPGIENGGGLIGESKHAIMTHLPDGPQRLTTVLIEAAPTPAERAAKVRQAMAGTAALKTFPVVLKPDAGQRGFAVRVIKSDDQIEPYFAMMPRAAILQPYSPGPHECGVLWARSTKEGANGQAGFIYSITRKDFPELVGDGERTVEELLYAHPRHRRQVNIFLDRFPDSASHILAPGEVMHLGIAGNHCQGAMFRDGADLITPGLSSSVDALARDFKGGLDFGRLDLRYTSEQALSSGDFTIVELNGTTGESTNVYDPKKSIFWAYRVLMGQWKLLFELGAARRCQGARPMTIIEMLKTISAYYRSRRGSALSD